MVESVYTTDLNHVLSASVEMPIVEMPIVEMPIVEMPIVEMPIVELLKFGES